jgi:hypothetical protein
MKLCRGGTVIGVDLPGSGHSSWLPPGVMYHDLEFIGHSLIYILDSCIYCQIQLILIKDLCVVWDRV